MIFRRFIAALALLCAVSPAYAQKTKSALNTQLNASFPDNSVGAITPALVRNATLDIVNSIMPTAPVVSGDQVCFDGTTGLLKDCAAAPILAITSPLVLSGNNLSCPTCLTSISGALYISSRAVAATLDLHLSNVIQTGGYTTPGDGGGATFQKISSGTTFTDQTIDTQVSPPTLVGGSGYTNATYLGVSFSGGSGRGCEGSAVVSGGAVSQVNVAIPCPGYKVGDVLTAANSFLGGAGSGFTWTVTAINVAQGSFSDSAGDLWQIVTDAGNFPNVLQFGAQGNWNGSDSGITNSRPAFVSAIAYVMYAQQPSANPPGTGGTLIVPKGNFLVCGGTQGATLADPQGVIIRGAGRWGGSSIVQCAAESGNNHGMWLCDPLSFSGQFGCEVEELALNTSQSTPNTGVFAFASNSGQQFELLHNVGILAGQRGCLLYNFGRGGAANTIFNGAECAQTQGVTTPGIQIGSSVGGDLVIFRDWVIECAGTGCNRDAIVVGGTPFAVFQGVHSEANLGTAWNITATGGSVSIRDSSVSGAPTCSSAIIAQATNPAGSILMENIQSGCTIMFINGRTGGNITGSTVGQVVK